jgi:hypothetical protein
MRDHIEIIILIIFIKLRWIYFHIHPSYYKFKMSETECHFQNLKTNTIHSQIKIQFKENSWWARFN